MVKLADRESITISSISSARNANKSTSYQSSMENSDVGGRSLAYNQSSPFTSLSDAKSHAIKVGALPFERMFLHCL
jgi:hypothetical protein